MEWEAPSAARCWGLPHHVVGPGAGSWPRGIRGLRFLKGLACGFAPPKNAQSHDSGFCDLVFWSCVMWMAIIFYSSHIGI